MRRCATLACGLLWRFEWSRRSTLVFNLVRASYIISNIMVRGPDQSMHMEAGPATRMHAAVAHDEATKVQYVYMRCVRTIRSRWRL